MLGSGISEIVQWLTLSTALENTLLTLDPVNVTAWGRLATSVGLWLILPAAVGIWRTLRREAS
ncbi:MAG: hypothetical protein Q4D79_11975 [Propionibacteriaceae bacterium]|nr:hypothetical protein [Propionibacteriaceae bacterium]